MICGQLNTYSECLRSSIDHLHSDLQLIHLRLDQPGRHVRSMMMSGDQIQVELCSTSSRLITVNAPRSRTEQSVRVSGIPYRFSQLQSVMERENQPTPQPLLSARDVLISRMTGRLSDKEPSALMRLHEDDKHDLARLVREQLLQYPADLKDASENLIRVSQSRSKRPSTIFDANYLNCHCVPFQRIFVSTIGAFELSFKSNSDHQPNCRFYVRNKRSWDYGLAVNLLPFLNKTVEVMISMAIGAGGASIAPNLRFYGTVKRSESATFLLFDKCYQECAVTVYSGPRFYELANDFIPFWDHSTFLIFDWEVKKTGRFLIEALESMRELFASDDANAVDKDELGHSIFHVRIKSVTKWSIRSLHV